MGSGFSRCFRAGAPLDEYEMELFEQAMKWREREKRLQQAEIAENEQKWRKWITGRWVYSDPHRAHFLPVDPREEAQRFFIKKHFAFLCEKCKEINVEKAQFFYCPDANNDVNYQLFPFETFFSYKMILCPTCIQKLKPS